MTLTLLAMNAAASRKIQCWICGNWAQINRFSTYADLNCGCELNRAINAAYGGLYDAARFPEGVP